MGDILKEWLGSTVERELGIALELWERTSSFASDADKYDDDGTTFRIKLSKGYPVQITKLVNLHGPITVLVSDSMTDINASITKATADHFLTKYRRRVTQGTLGGIIHLQNFDIMVTYMGPDQSCRIILSIKTFEFLGSEASPVFGSPRAIQDSMAIRSLEKKLRALRTANFAQLEPATDDKPASDSIPQSGIDRFELSSDDNEENSQHALATQAPFRSHKTNPRIHRPPALQDGKTFSPAQLKHLPGVKEGQLTDKENARIALSGSPSRQISLKPSRPTGNEVKKQSEALLQLLPSELSRAKRIIKKVESPTGSDSSRSEDTEGQEPRAKPIKKVKHRDESSLVVPGSVHLVEGAGLPPQQKTKIGVVAEYNPDSLRAEAESPGQIPSRISRRVVLIPKNQQDLLEQPDSWLPVEPGRRYPFANVPIKTLQEISDSADRRAVRLSKQPEKVKPTSSAQREPAQPSESDEESDGESAYDSGSIASSDWPPSSPARVNEARQLPPDSSPELSINTVKFLQKKPQERFSSVSPPPRNSASVSKKRKPVNTSPSYSLPSPSRRPVDDSKLHPKPTPPFGNDPGLSNLAHSGQVTETDYSQGTDGDQTHKESGILELKRPGDLMKGHDDSTGVGTIKEHGNLVNSNNTDPSQPSLDSHGISTTEIESSGHRPEPQISNCNAENEKRLSHLDNTPIESGPSTASQQEDPGLEVKRTPYCNGLVSDIDSQILESCKSPSKSRSLPFANDIRVSRDTYSLSTQPDIVNASCIDSQRAVLSDDLAICIDVEAARNIQLQKQDVPRGELAIYSHGEERGHDIPDENLIAAQLQREIASQSQSGASRSYVEETRLIVDETVFQPIADLRTALSVPPGTQAMTIDEDGKGMKRKHLENELLSPNITKRRRNLRDVGEPDRKVEDVLTIERALGILSNGASASSSSQGHAMQLSAEGPRLFDQIRNGKAAGHDGESTAAQYKPEKPSTSSSSTPPNAQVRRARECEQGLGDTPRTSTEIPADESIIDVDSQEIKGERPPNKVYSVSVESVQPSRNITIFDRFKLSYSEYSGNMQHFTAICSKLQNRIDAGRGLHQALWDDFILRHKIEYASYLQNCTNKVEDPMPYDKFYEDEIDGARFIKQVVTRKTLHEALALPPSNEEKVVDRGRSSCPVASPRVDKSRHSSRNSQLGSACASPQIIEFSEKTPEISSRRSLPWLSPNPPRSTPRLNPVTPSTPQPSFSSRIRSNQPSTSSHLSRKKPETEGNFHALLSTVNTPTINRGDASVLEAPPDRASEVALAVDVDYRRVKRDVVRTLDNASLRDGPRSRMARDTERVSSNAPSLDASGIRRGGDISQASSNAPPADAPRHRVTRNVSETSSDTPLLGTDYRRIKRDSDRAPRESRLRTTDYRTSARNPDQKPEASLLNTAHPELKRVPDQVSNETLLPDADARRSNLNSARATEDSPRRTLNRRKVKRCTDHPPDTSVLPKPPLPHRSSKPTDAKPSTTTTLPKPVKTETADDDDDNNNPLLKFAREYLAIEAGRGNSFADPKRSYDVKERPRLRKLDVANWHL